MNLKWIWYRRSWSWNYFRIWIKLSIVITIHYFSASLFSSNILSCTNVWGRTTSNSTGEILNHYRIYEQISNEKFFVLMIAFISFKFYQKKKHIYDSSRLWFEMEWNYLALRLRPCCINPAWIRNQSTWKWLISSQRAIWTLWLTWIKSTIWNQTFGIYVFMRNSAYSFLFFFRVAKIWIKMVINV